jgi:hypothetical protein
LHGTLEAVARSKKTLLSEAGRLMSAARKNRRGGGGKRSRTLEHDPSVPIGSRETVSTPYKRYKCMCLDCRIARGYYPKRETTPPKR